MKKLLILTLVFVLALSLAACGGNTVNSNSNGNNSTNPLASQNSGATAPSGDTAPSDATSDATSGATAPSGDTGGENDPVSGDPQGSENIIPIGTTATSTFANRHGVTHSVSMCVEETIRSDAALSFINDEMMAKKTIWSAEAPADEDQEYMVARITYTLLAYDDGDSKSPSNINVFSGEFEAYPSLIAGMFYDKDNNYPELTSLEVNVGETVTGYEIFQINKDDLSPVMTYASYFTDLSDGLWFKLY